MDPGIMEWSAMGLMGVAALLGFLAPLVGVVLVYLGYRRWRRHAEVVEESLAGVAQQLARLRDDLAGKP